MNASARSSAQTRAWTSEEAARTRCSPGVVVGRAAERHGGKDTAAVGPWRHLPPYSRESGVLESWGRDRHSIAWRLGEAADDVAPDTRCARCGDGFHPNAGDWMYNDPALAYVCATCAGILQADYRYG